MNNTNYIFLCLLILTFFQYRLADTIPSDCEVYIKATSAGLESGNFFRVWVNNNELTSLTRGRGLNFVQIDPYTKEVLDSRRYDTYCCSDQTANMVTYINQIPSGIIVVVGVIDEASNSMSSAAYSALAKLGGSGTMSYRSGWVLIGGKERKASGKIVQQHIGRYGGAAVVSTCITNKIPNTCSKYLSVQSGGMLDWERYQIYMNYLSQDVSWRTRGSNVQVYDPNTGAVKSNQGFDTLGNASKTNEFVNFINNIATGDWVSIGILDEGGSNLNADFYNAIKSVGGPSSLNIAYRDSFALIGRKGDSPDTATYLHRLNEHGGVQIDRCLLGCHYQCATCSMEPSQCTSCSRTTNVDATTCLCQDSYYENSSQNCVKCLLKCAKCINGSSCTECSNGVGRSSSCGCNAGYYEKSGDNKDCGQCSYPCQTCSGSATSCLSCQTTVGRVSSTNCSCKDTYYETGSECKPCVYPCLNCSSASTCLSCKTTPNRVSVTNCNCKDTYYDDNSECVKCSYPCLNCSNSSTCTSCSTTDNRANTSSCTCQSNYFDNGSNCQKCHYKCSECQGQYDTCKTSCTDAVNRDFSQNCTCKPGFYDINNTANCGQCQYPCQTCSGSATSCLSCKTTVGRVSPTDCSCKDTFYESGSECKPCQYPCLNCTSATSCLSCSTTANRVSTTDCNCKDTYYDDNSECVKCPYPCQNCTNASTCTSCATTEFRLQTSDCGCQDGYYDNNSKCTPCIYPCKHCSSATQCEVCAVDANRQNSHPCNCNSNYFDNGSNCQQCHYKCGECSGQYDSCETQCSDTVNRDLSQNCACKVGFYDITNTASCGQCSYQCKSCSVSADSCSVCSDLVTRDSSTSDCKCKKGYYDIPNQAVCGQCNYPCSSCETSADNCLECSHETRPLKPDCNCQLGYYDDTLNNAECLICDYQCKECSQSSDKCSECSHSTRDGSNTQCLCKNGYFDDGNDNAECQECIHPCANCSAINVCTSCVVGTNRLDHTKGCVCEDGYYNSGTQGNCVKCPERCSKCTDANTCTECVDGVGRSDQLPNCECKDKYFDDGTNKKDCTACVHPCETCTSLTSCDNCLVRDFIVSAPQCTCQSGYYETSGLVCEICTSPCKTCVNTSTNCSSCIDGPNRQATPSCLCKDGFYENSDLECVPCVYPCQHCSSENVCKTCQTTLNRIIPSESDDTKDCSCEDGYFDNDSDCEKCNFKCLTCVDTAINCIQCSELTRVGEDCHCKDGFFDIGVSQCSQCEYQCGTCHTEADNCQTCSEDSRDINNKCKCKSGFFENSDNKCVPCQYPCTTCKTLKICDSCVITGPERLLPHCQCTDGYYEDIDILQCLLCDNQCKTCAFTSDNCTVCINGKGREKAPSCLCKVDYYLDEDTQKCEKCNSQCATCDNSNSCITCINSLASPPNCQVVSNVASFSVNIGTNNIEKEEQQCAPQCEQCEDQANNCLTCNIGLNRINNPPLCSCQESYYSVDYTYDCQKCHHLCKTCISALICQECLDIPNRILNKFTGFCECQSGFKENSQKECEKCYFYQDKCVFSCPQNTISDEIKGICQPLEIISQDNTLPLLVVTLMVVGLMAVKGIFFIIKTNQKIKACSQLDSMNQTQQKINKSSSEEKYSNEEKI